MKNTLLIFIMISGLSATVKADIIDQHCLHSDGQATTIERAQSYSSSLYCETNSPRQKHCGPVYGSRKLNPEQILNNRTFNKIQHVLALNSQDISFAQVYFDGNITNEDGGMIVFYGKSQKVLERATFFYCEEGFETLSINFCGKDGENARPYEVFRF